MAVGSCDQTATAQRANPHIQLARLRDAIGTPAVIELWDPSEADKTVLTVTDILVLNNFSPDDIRYVRNRAFGRIPPLDIAVKSAIDVANAADYAMAGAQMLVTSTPLSAHRADIVLTPLATTGEVPSCA